MTTADAIPNDPAVPPDRRWDATLLTQREQGRRNRRTIDSVSVGAAAVVIGLTAVVASSASAQDAAVEHAVATVFGWAEAFWRVAFFATLGLSLVVVVAVLVGRRWSLARDLLAAVGILLAATSILGRTVEADWFPIEAHMLSRWGYPEFRLAAATAVFVVVGPELVRPVRVLAAWLVPLASLGAVVLGAVSPSAALAGLALGLGAGAIVRLAFGTAAGVPPTEQVRAAALALGVVASDLVPSTRQRVGYAQYVGHDTTGRALKVRVLGRDAEDTQRVARRWRLLAYRDPPRSAAVGRLEQVEHEALATLMAAQAGVSVPAVVTAALGPDGDALVVTREPDVEPLEAADADQVGDATLARGLWRQVARLHAAGISHGRLNASNVLLADVAPCSIDFSAATLGAPRSALDIDVAELLVACTVLVGPERALREAIAAAGNDAIAHALPYLQRAALTPHLRTLARAHEVGVEKLRTDAPPMPPARSYRRSCRCGGFAHATSS